MDNAISYISILVVLVLLILWAFSQLHDIFNTWQFYKEQKHYSMANDWVVTNIQRFLMFLSLLIFSLIVLLHWVALPSYYALYGG